VFGWLVRPDDSGSSDEPALVVAVLLLVVGILLLVTAARALLADDDPDAPPPRWMAAFDAVRPGKAFILGAGLIAVSAKFWVFTLSALGAIEAAELSASAAVAAYVGFVALAQSLVLTVIAVAIVVPRRSDAFLARVSDWLERYDRAIVVVVGLVFGTWFLVKALDGLGLW
jgi:cadmium resistance protein CadD (predicted permease)